MNFWTLMANRSTRRFWGVDSSFCFPFRGALETDEDVNKAYSAVAMANPDTQDLCSLGNALVGQWSDHLYIAVSPFMCDTGVSRNRFKTRSEQGYSWHRWFDEWKDSMTLVKDGKLVPVCEGCSKIMYRASGACYGGVLHCGRPMFPKGAQLNLPPEHLYMPLSKCCHREPFGTYEMRNIHPDVSPSSPLESTVDKEAGFKAGTSVMFRNLVCPACMCYANGHCVRNAHQRSCNGPYFEADVPEPQVHLRHALRLMNKAIPYDLYKKHREGTNWTQTNWQEDPRIVVGIPGSKLLPVLVKTSCKGKDSNKYAMLTRTADSEAITRLFKLKVDVPSTPPTLMEKLACVGVSFGSMYSGCEVAWGGFSEFYGVSYHDGVDEVQAHHLLYRHLNTFRFKFPLELLREYFGIAQALSTGIRGRTICSLIERRKELTKPFVVKVVREVIGDLSEAAKLGRGIPEIKGLVAECTARVQQRRELWKPVKVEPQPEPAT